MKLNLIKGVVYFYSAYGTVQYRAVHIVVLEPLRPYQ